MVPTWRFLGSVPGNEFMEDHEKAEKNYELQTNKEYEFRKRDSFSRIVRVRENVSVN